MVAKPADIVTRNAWSRSVPTTLLAESGKSVTNVMPKKTPDPTDVRPRMNPKMTPMITAYVLWRVVSSPSVGSFEASHRPRIETNVRMATGSHALTLPKTLYSMNVPMKAAGTEPVAIQSASSRFTFLSWWWRAAPNAFVIAAYTRSVPTAVLAGMPKTEIRIGVMSDPAPIPVNPTRMPTPSPAATSPGSIVPPTPCRYSQLSQQI